MRIAALEGISLHERTIDDQTIKLAEAHTLMERFEQRTEMCFKLKEGLEDFQAGLDALADTTSEDKGTKYQREVTKYQREVNRYHQSHNVGEPLPKGDNDESTEVEQA